MKNLLLILAMLATGICAAAQSTVQAGNIIIYCQSVNIITQETTLSADSTMTNYVISVPNNAIVLTLPAQQQEPEEQAEPTPAVANTQATAEVAPAEATQNTAQSVAPKATPKRSISYENPRLKFAWGADLGASADMSGNDMSSIDLDLNAGISRGWINFLGIGAQANITVANSQRYYPLFVLFRTNFTNRPTRFFWELKGGVSLNYIESLRQQLGSYAFTGCGIKLASSNRFTSHLTLGYTWLQRRGTVGDETNATYPDLHYVTIKLGLTL